jgi:hypothetical protein
VFLVAGRATAQSRMEDVTFTSHGVTLAGSIVPPDMSPVRAAVVYDKRGAGRSGGETDRAPRGQAGHRYDYVLFSGLGHNNLGRTFATVIDWITR